MACDRGRAIRCSRCRPTRPGYSRSGADALTAIFRGIHLDPTAPGSIFASPNTSAIMSSVPARDRGAASGMRATVQNSGMSWSIGFFFSLMIAGLAATLPRTSLTYRR